MKTKKYFWLKLQRDFFKRHDIQIIEGMPNGEKYLIFYLKLLCESVDHDGSLRFSDEIPYDEGMLSIITHMDIDIVRAAVKLFTNLKMMEIMDDGTFFMNQIEKMTGSETSWARKKSLYRETKREDNVLDVSTQCPIRDKSIEIRDKSIEIRDKSIDNIYIPKTKPPKESRLKHGEYNHVLLTSTQYLKLVDEWGESELLRMIKILDEGIQTKGYKYKDFNLALRKWKANEQEKKQSVQLQNLQGKVRMKNDIYNGETF